MDPGPGACGRSDSLQVADGTMEDPWLLHSSAKMDAAELYKKQAMEILTFEENPDLLRGIPLARVMRMCASLFAESVGTAGTYRLSKPVQAIRIFISHNWVVPRWKKCLALSLHFNFRIAVFGLVLEAILLLVLTLLGWAPCFDDFVIGDPAPVSILAKVTAAPIFLLVLLLGRDCLQCIGLEGPFVFLDKSCIHQTDHHIQRQGILKLGGFLHHSETMLVLFTPVYLEKLWTIYELAAFLLQHPVSKMKVIIVDLSVVYCFAVLAYSAGPVTIAICRSYKASDDYGVIATMIVTFSYLVMLRSWHRQRSTLEEKLRKFSVHDALCAVESDRSVVYANIVALMKAFDRVPHNTSIPDTLEKFDQVVRSQLPKAFEASLGRSSFTHGQIIVMSYVSSLTMVVDMLGGLSTADEHSVRGILADSAVLIIWGFLFYPLIWYGKEQLVALNLQWCGWMEIIYLMSIEVIFIILEFPFIFVLRRSRECAQESTDDILISAMLGISLVILTLGNLVLRPLFSRHRYHKRETSEDFEVALGRSLALSKSDVRPDSPASEPDDSLDYLDLASI